MSPLGAYLLANGQKPWDWGTVDCCTFAADWCVSLEFPDPMAAIRGAYETEAEAQALVQKHGLLRLVDRGLRGIGWARTLDPKTGDIGLVRRMGPVGTDTVCAIRSEGRWVTRTAGGYYSDDAGELLRAWKPPHG